MPLDKRGGGRDEAAVRKRAVSFHFDGNGEDEDETQTPTSADSTDADVAHKQQEQRQRFDEQAADANLGDGTAATEVEKPALRGGRHNTAPNLFHVVEDVRAELRAERKRTTEAAQVGSMLVERNAALESEVKQLREQLHDARHDAVYDPISSPGSRRAIRSMPSRTDTARSTVWGGASEADHSPEREPQAARRAEVESLEDRLLEKEHELQAALDECDEFRRNYDRLQREQQRLHQEHERAMQHLQEELQEATQSAASRSSPRRPSESQLFQRAQSFSAPSEPGPERPAADEAEEDEHTSADRSDIETVRSELDALRLKTRQLEEDLRHQAYKGANAEMELKARDEALQSLQAGNEELHKLLQEARSKQGKSFMQRLSVSKSAASTNNLGQSMYAAHLRGNPDDWDHRRQHSMFSSEAAEEHSKDIAGFEIEAPPNQQAMQAQTAADAERSQLLLDLPFYCCRMVLMRPGSDLGRPFL